MRNDFSLAWGALLLASSALGAQSAPDTTIKIVVGGFVDAYYAWDFGRPPDFDRSFALGNTFTTQPARHDEFNVNLGYLEANLSGNRLRGRFALQAGTSVQSNYAAEPTNGTISGPSLSRMIQEAFAGYLVTPTLWIDGGIFYSNMGLESWASKDNPSYSRSLVAEYSPYYSSGVRAMWQATAKLSLRLDVVNGWQNISESNTEKGVGVRLDYAINPSTTVTYYNFFNDEVDNRFRIFNGAGAKWISPTTTLLAEVDVGTLGAPSVGGESADWWGFTVVARQLLTPMVAIVGRVERYDDPGQVNIATGLPFPFRGNGASVGFDVALQPRLWWRSEGRGFFNDQPIFPNGGSAPRSSGGFVVSAITLVF